MPFKISSIASIAFLILFSNCASIGVVRTKDIVFDQKTKLALDIYSPKKNKQSKPVFVFLHGGSWASGKKSQYKFLGRRLAHKGIIAIVPDYRLSSQTSFKGMAMDVAASLRWVKENINKYSGDTSRIFIAGHSAGGHLAALVSTDDDYFDSLRIASPITGTILIDPFGLDMYGFLSSKETEKVPSYYATFSKDPTRWKKGSPFYHIHRGMAPVLMFVGGRTYDVIKEDSKTFQVAVKKYQPDVQLINVPRKKHIPMILMFFNSRNKAYKTMQKFMIGK